LAMMLLERCEKAKWFLSEHIFMHIYLICRYGGVPIITKLFGFNDDDFSVLQNSYDECVLILLFPNWTMLQNYCLLDSRTIQKDVTHGLTLQFFMRVRCGQQTRKTEAYHRRTGFA
jgi:hypothetical protein